MVVVRVRKVATLELKDDFEVVSEPMGGFRSFGLIIFLDFALFTLQKLTIFH